MTVQTFLLPDLGEGLTEAVLLHWSVAVGDTVVVDQVVAEVETAKSVVELPTPFAGVVLALHGAEGDEIATGSPVLQVGEPGDELGDGNEGGGAAAQPDSAGETLGAETEAYREEERAGSGNVLIGYGTGSLAGKGRRRRRTPASRPAAAGESAAAEGSGPADAAARGPVAMSSPIVRRLAKELGVDPRSVSPTRADGAVTRADVLRAAETGSGRPAAIVAASSPPGTSGEAASAMHGLRLRSSERLSPLRKAVSARLSRSRSEIPEATVWVDVDFTELWGLRLQMATGAERPPSITAMVARFVLLALEDYPLLASRLSDDASELLTFDGVNLGIAVDAERGLSVPVLPRADELSVLQLDTALRELSAEARTGRLAPARLTGSTFTFNNYGGFGVDGSAAIINHPEVAIFGMGRIIERPWVVEGEISVRRIAQLSLAFDHRVCDGGYASGFFRSVVEMIEHPLRLFGRL